MRPGAKVGGRFVVERLLARGGMGEVFVAHDALDDRLVALKVVRFQGATYQARFRREAQILERLRHAAIVRHLAHGLEDDGGAWLAMEWIEGEDLRARQRRAPLPLDAAMDVGARIADALATAHAVGVVHRDLKPSNVLLREGDPARACLIDFGVAYVLDADEALTTSTGIIGTPGYMSPEQARGAPIDARADLFSLGCLLFTLAVGAPPFEGPDSIAAIARLLFHPSPRIHGRRPEVPGAVDALVASLMHKDPSERPSSASAVADALRDLAPLCRGVAGASATGTQRASSVPRLACLVLGLSPSGVTSQLEEDSMEGTLAAHDGDAFAEIAQAHDARVLPLGRGSVLFVLTGGTVASDIAERAVRCARALSLARADLSVAVGTGVGETTSVAALGSLLERTRALAERARGRLLVDGPTARLVDDRWQTIAVDDGAGAHQLLGRATHARAPRALLGRASPFVGREGELGLLRAVVSDGFADPSPRVAMIFGEPGAGKSRLRQELLRSIDASVWSARGDLLAKRSPLGLARQLLRAALDVPEGRATPMLHARIAETMRDVEGDHDVTAALLVELLGGAPSHDEPTVLRAARQDARIFAEQTRAAFARFVAAAARRAPLVLSIDDLQWCDASSLQYIDAAIGLAEASPLLVLVFGRSEARAAFPGIFGGRHVTALDLPPLSRAAARSLARAVLPHLEPAVVDRLSSLSGGNPFYLEELIREAARGGDLARAEGLVPVIQARIDGLSVAAQRALRAASIFGHVFWSHGVEAIVGDAATVEAGLAELHARELVARRATARFGDEDEWIMRNELVHEVVYALLAPDERARGHLRAAHWLTAAGEQDALVLAEHFERGHALPAASRWLRRATEAALEASALEDAAALAKRALAIAPDEEKSALWLLLADVHRLRGDFAAAVDAAAAVEALAPASSSAHRRALAERVAALVRLGRVREAIESSAPLTTKSEDASHAPHGRATDALEGLALSRAAMALAIAGAPSESRAVLATISNDSLRDGPLLRPSRDAVHAMLALSQEGDIVRYVTASEAALAGFEAASDPRSASVQRINLGYGNILLGAADEAIGHLDAASKTTASLGLPHLRAAALHNLGLAHAMRGDHARAIALQRQALDAFVAQGDLRLAGGARCYLARSLAETGETNAALTEAMAAVEALAGYPPTLAHAYIALSRAHRAAKQGSFALDAARRAVELTKTNEGARDAHVAALVDLAQCLYDVGGDDEPWRAAVGDAQRALQATAARISDPARRETYLRGVPEHARLHDLVARAARR